MTTTGGLGVAIALLTLMWLVISAVLAAIVRVVLRWSRAEQDTAELRRIFTKHVQDTTRLFAEMTAQIREDRRVTHERLTYLERERMKQAGRRT